MQKFNIFLSGTRLIDLKISISYLFQNNFNNFLDNDSKSIENSENILLTFKTLNFLTKNNGIKLYL